MIRMSKITDLPIQTIAVLRALKLGDFLVATPAFRALRAAFPKTTIDYVGLPWAEDLVLQRYRGYFSGFVPFPGFPELLEQPWQPAAVTDFLRHMQRQKYDLAIQLHGQGNITNSCIALWGARAMAGFAPPGSAWLGMEWFMEYPERQPEIRRLLLLLEHCGIPALGEDLDFPVTPADEQELAATPIYKELKSPYVCIHPGAASSRPWPAEHFAAVADTCVRMGYTVAITGVEAESKLAKQMAWHMRRKALVFAGATSLGSLAALIQQASLYIGNDTGTSHLAVAVGTPSITIFSTSDPQRWAPLNPAKHRVILREQATPNAVWRQAQAALKQQGGKS